MEQVHVLQRCRDVDGKDPDGPTLSVSPVEWQMFVDAIVYQQLSTYSGPLMLARAGRGPWLMTHDRSVVFLSFTDHEVAAFVEGVKAGLFDLAALTESAGDGSDTDSAARVCGAAVAQEEASPVSL
jgi:hypothetical protein